MYPLPGSPGENEPDAPELEPKDQDDVQELWESLWIWYLRGLVIGSMVLTVVRLLQSEELQLHMLNRGTKILGTIARLFGSWSLRSEQAYYHVVDSIPH